MLPVNMAHATAPCFPDDSDRSTASHVSFACDLFAPQPSALPVSPKVAPCRQLPVGLSSVGSAAAAGFGVVGLDSGADVGLDQLSSENRSSHSAAGAASTGRPAARKSGYRKLWALVNSVKKGERVRGGQDEVSVSGVCGLPSHGPLGACASPWANP